MHAGEVPQRAGAVGHRREAVALRVDHVRRLVLVRRRLHEGAIQRVLRVGDRRVLVAPATAAAAQEPAPGLERLRGADPNAAGPSDDEHRSGLQERQQSERLT